MGKISKGIIVDGFNIKEDNCAYFLTHWHADHYMGITNKWTYGPIYASTLTRKFLLTKYPKLQQNVLPLEIGSSYQLINPKNEQNFQVSLFEANHMAGSVMYLFEFKNGYKILHTGDMRFNAQLMKKHKNLFEQIENKPSQFRCKYTIDALYIDNTYCDPIFQFPNRSDAINMAKSIIDKNRERVDRVYLITHTIGKQQALLALSVYYKTKIIVCQERYLYVKQILQKRTDQFFSTNQQDGWIQVIKAQQKQLITKYDKNSIIITLTGWANLRDYHQFTTNQYIVPYSLHSNYEELQLFVSAVRPKKMHPVVNHHDDKKSTDFRSTIHSYQSYFNSLTYMKQRGFQFLKNQYTAQQVILKKQIKQKYQQQIQQE